MYPTGESETTRDEVISISREELSDSKVDSIIAHQKSLMRQLRPEVPHPEHDSTLRRVLLSNLFYTPLAGLLGGLTAWMIFEPYLEDTVNSESLLDYVVLPLTGALIALFIFITEGLASRSWGGGRLRRWLNNIGFTILFIFLSYIPMGFVLMLILILPDPPNFGAITNIKEFSPAFITGFFIIRSLMWAIAGTAIGLGMNLTRSSEAQLRASVMGGAIGGALGGLFFDPIDRFILQGTDDAYIPRLVGQCAVGLCIGLFVALSERLGRDGWVRVRTGPLAGKSFILYRNPTVIGSAPKADIYLFKDAGIAPEQAAILRVGTSYEIEDLQSGNQTIVNNRVVQRQRLHSADQIVIGATILDFEERAARPVLSVSPPKEK